VSVAKFV